MLDFLPQRIGHAIFFEEEEWRQLKTSKIPVGYPLTFFFFLTDLGFLLLTCFLLLSETKCLYHCWPNWFKYHTPLLLSLNKFFAGRDLFDIQHQDWINLFNWYSPFWFVVDFYFIYSNSHLTIKLMFVRLTSSLCKPVKVYLGINNLMIRITVSASPA